MRVVLAASALAAAAVPTSAFAVDYLSAEQAAKLMFPDADAFVARTVTLDAAQLQQLYEQIDGVDSAPTEAQRIEITAQLQSLARLESGVEALLRVINRETNPALQAADERPFDSTKR